MTKVNILDEHTSNLIAAGEVVIDPKSVIKELVENSLDAQATHINITIEEAGYKNIIIDDNGFGMSFEDAQKSIKRHATSKIKNQNDLNSIHTLGFRGEALPSIASVSFFELETTNQITSSCIKINGGKILTQDNNTNRKKGTKITVSNLFYNTPARLKHQVSTKYQYLQIKEYICQMSLIHPNIKFTLIHNDVTILNSIENDLLANVSQIYGLEVAKNMNMIDHETMDFKISGFYIDPKYSKTNKKAMLFSINKRLIWSNSLANSVIEALSSYLMVKKYPICYLDIEIDTSLIDVNVHPQKKLVKISKEEKLCQLIIDTIKKNMLENLTLFTVEDSNEIESQHKAENKLNKNKYIQPTYDKFIASSKSYDNEIPKTEINSIFSHSEINSQLTHPSELENLNFKQIENKYTSNEDNKNFRNNMPILNYLGQYLNSYILAQSESTLILVDQHAAMERINYEKYLKQLTNSEKYTQTLALPISINISIQEMEILLQNEHILKKVAITFEQFGKNTILIRNVPSFINTHKVEKFLELILECVFNNKELTQEILINEMAIIKACKLSLKANQQIDAYEANKLIEQLYYVSNYTSCPHGRPISIKLEKKQIEKWFKRIV